MFDGEGNASIRRPRSSEEGIQVTGATMGLLNVRGHKGGYPVWQKQPVILGQTGVDWRSLHMGEYILGCVSSSFPRPHQESNFTGYGCTSVTLQKPFAMSLS